MRERGKENKYKQRAAEGESEVMAAATSPLHPPLHPSIIQYTFRSNSQCLLDISLLCSILYPPLLRIFPLSISLTVTHFYSPEITSGLRDLVVKCQIFIDVFSFFRILIRGTSTFLKGRRT